MYFGGLCIVIWFGLQARFSSESKLGLGEREVCLEARGERRKEEKKEGIVSVCGTVMHIIIIPVCGHSHIARF